MMLSESGAVPVSTTLGGMLSVPSSLRREAYGKSDLCFELGILRELGVSGSIDRGVIGDASVISV